ncbi:hypothetical protein [Nitrosomonas communis]|uniref:PGAP1-like alpha/beta domain-containing protein n=1 Tax=Nitrosomonas communis TaxID=44574 RepID=UPI0026F329DC|nr:hypothetical protein [Nitrosomonas communis]MCO6427634.1 hypothetical protein [Nitrosomonas communis]
MKKICASMILAFCLIFISSSVSGSSESAETGNTDINIVLAHGIFGLNKIGSTNYFNGVEEHLKNSHNAKVLVANVSPVGGIRERGNQLRQQIINAINNPNEYPFFNPKAPIHIIAHSMGGLDSRFILSLANPDNIANLITSLTTIGTPHKGSPLADLFFLGFNPLVNFLKLWFNVNEFLKSLSELGIKKDGIQDLTTVAMHKFNQEYEDNPNVSYFWIAGIGRDGSLNKTSHALSLTYAYIRIVTQEDNDGAVALSSAKRGEAIGVPWFADHLDQVGHDLDHPPHGIPEDFNYLAKYDEIIARIRSIQSK